MASLKAALFDLDGTLIDTEGQYSVFWRRAGIRYCPHVPDVADRIKGTTMATILSRYFPDPAVQAALRRELWQWELGMDYPLYPGAMELLGTLRRNGVRLALVTSSDREKMRNVRRKLPSLLALFDLVLTGEDFTASKPDPSCYVQAAEALGCGRDECVVFEDALTGLEAGVRAGIFTFGLPTTNSREAIAPRCHCVLPSLEGLTMEGLLSLCGKEADT